MPFVEIDVEKEIEEKRRTDPAFRKAWDESREEYKRIGDEISKKKKHRNPFLKRTTKRK